MKVDALAAVSVFSDARRADSAQRRFKDWHLYLIVAVLVLATWAISRGDYFRPGDDVRYWLGVSGGTMMLLLFSYPLRKYFRFAHGWGKVKWWLAGHMVLGIGGPLLILLHSGFEIRSMNAGVALWSMIVVALSGIVGRFLYVRVHRGLHGRRSDLMDLQSRAGLAQDEIRSRFRFVPEVAERLLAFEAIALPPNAAKPGLLRPVVLLPGRQRLVYMACMRDVDRTLRTLAGIRGWDDEHLRKRRRQLARLTRKYLQSVVRVAQFSAYERLFALWHVLHVPFVYLLILTAVFHVFAVHAY